MGNLDWIVVDTETTGIAQPIFALEIAAQKMQGLDPIGEPFRVFLNHEVKIPKGAQAIHGYSEDFIRQNGISPAMAYRLFEKYVEQSPICAYNLPYDFDKVLMPEWERLGVAPLTRGFCVLQLTRRLISPSPTGNYKLQSLRSHFQLPERNAHSALGDVQTVVDMVVDILSPKLVAFGLDTPEKISLFLTKHPLPERLPFGKHKGRHWREALTDPDMISWLKWLQRSGGADGRKTAIWYLSKIEEAKRKRWPSEPPLQKVNVTCVNCGKTLALPAGRSGTVKCPICNFRFHANTR